MKGLGLGRALGIGISLWLGMAAAFAQSGEGSPAAGPSSKVEPIAVLGQVRKPGTVPFRDGMTLRDALQAAGGFTPLADPAAISMRRLGKGIGTVDGAKAMAGDAVQNVRLRAGDTFFVPRRADAPGDDDAEVGSGAPDPSTRIAIVGSVKEPGAFLYEPAMILDALAAAGGPTKDAELRKIVVRRGYLIDPTTSKSFIYDLEKVKQNKAADVPIQPGDVIEVPKRGRKTFFGTVGGAFTQVGRLIGSIARPILGVRNPGWPR